MDDSIPEKDCVTEHEQPMETQQIEDVTTLNQSSADEKQFDPYAYIDNNGFTSEKFKIEIKGLPKYWGIAQLRKLLKTKLLLNFNKIKLPRQGCNGRTNKDQWVYVCFRCESDKEEAIKVINGLKWKNTVLSAMSAMPAPDPLVKRRIEDTTEVKEPKSSLEDRVKDATTPLWKKSAEEQVNFKSNMIKEVLKDIVSGIKKLNPQVKEIFDLKTENGEFPIKLAPVVTGECTEGYRNKCEFTIGINEETGKKTIGQRIGTYASGSLEVGPIDSLLHIPDRMKEAVKVIEVLIEKSKFDIFNPETYAGYWRGLTLRCSIKTQQLMLIFTINPQQLNKQELDSFKNEIKEFFISGEGKTLNITSLYYQEIAKKTRGDETPVELLFGETHITEILCNLKFKISPLSFFQVNTGAAELLYEIIRSLTNLTPETTLVDVCCGTGSIGISLAKDCGQVLGLELVKQAVADARENAILNNVNNCTFYSGPAEQILQSVVDKATFDDVVVVVDPPRAGLRPNAIMMLRRIAKIKRIAYVACNIKAACQNIKDFARSPSKTMYGAPFVPIAVTPVDLFPHTKHVEAVIYLERLQPSTN